MELPRQLVIRKLAAASWWKVRDGLWQLRVLFPVLISAREPHPLPSLTNCCSVLVKSVSWCLFSVAAVLVLLVGSCEGRAVFTTHDLRFCWLVCCFLMLMWQSRPHRSHSAFPWCPWQCHLAAFCYMMEYCFYLKDISDLSKFCEIHWSVHYPGFTQGCDHSYGINL